MSVFDLLDLCDDYMELMKDADRKAAKFK